MPKAAAKVDPISDPLIGVVYPLAPADIDCLALEYTQIDEQIEKLSEKQKTIRAALVNHTQAHGSESPQGLKTKIARGEQYIVRVTRCERETVDSARAEDIEKKCPAHIFEALFQRVTKFSIAKDATQFLSKPLPKEAPRDLRKLFVGAVRTDEQTPRISVTKDVGFKG
jgi:hypothetical protein